MGTGERAAPALKGLATSTLLLAGASVLHAMRVIVLSLLLGNREFGAVSTLLLLSVLFAEFGTLGFGQLVYNQPQFAPGRRSWQAYRVGLFMLAGMLLASGLAFFVTLALLVQGPFGFVPLWLTLWCSALNMVTLSACRAASSRFTHPVGYAIKATIILIDIVVLGVIGLPMELMALWGEVAAFPVLLFYAWRVGILRRTPRMVQSVMGTIRKHVRIGLTAIMASASGIAFFNQERMFGATLLSLEQMGILTKLVLPKIIAAQASFLFGVHFHRWVVSLDPSQRTALLLRMKTWEIRVLPIAIIAILIGGWLTVQFNRIAYDLPLDLVTATAIATLALAFFVNPYAIFLQANNRFSDLANSNAIAFFQFFVTCMILSVDVKSVLIASAMSAFTWFLLIRHFAVRRL